MNTHRLAAVSTLALAGVLSLAACGSDNPQPKATGGAATSGGSGSSNAAGPIADCQTGKLKAEGSSAQKNAMDQVIAAYGKACPGAQIDYNPTGSGAGIKNFNAGQVDFAGSDSALKEAEAASAATTCGSPAWNIPMVTGPIAVAFNVKGLDALTVTPELMSKIFQGQITTWNDPAIAAANSGATLPATPIRVFFRSDDSGTTENFTNYLKASSNGAWTGAPAKKWTGKGEGKEKSAGVAGAVKATDGGITYVELSYAKDNGLKMAKVDNGGGAVELTSDSVGKAVAAAKQTGTGNDLKMQLDYATKAPGAYPILLVTYEIVCSQYKDAAKGTFVKSFLNYFASADAQKGLEARGYAPLPAAVQGKVATAVAAIK